MSQKTVLITGCSTGIGRLAARTFQAAGWNVIATMRRPQEETELNQLENVLVAPLDVTDSDSVDAAIAAGIDRFGGVDVLVNNAGRGGRALRQHFTNSADNAGGGTPADPQEVADRIFICATQDTPLQNPVGKDAEMIMGMMAAPPRQEFLDKLAPMILPE